MPSRLWRQVSWCLVAAVCFGEEHDLLAAPKKKLRGNLTRTVRKGNAVINYYARKPPVPLTAAEKLAIDFEIENRTLKAKAFVLRASVAPRPSISFSRAEVSYTSHFVYVDQTYKLLFSAVPKAACSEFMRLFHRLRNDTDWRAKNPHFRGDRPLLSRLVRRPSLPVASLGAR